MAHKPGHKKRGTRLKNLLKHSLKIINPGQDASNTYSKTDLERLRGIRNKNKNKTKRPTNPNPKQAEIDKIKKNMKNAKGANKDLMQKKIDQLNKYGKMSSFKIDKTRPDYVKAKKLNESIPTSGSGKTKTKRKTARETLREKNIARHGEAHVNKLKQKQVDFKKMRKGTMSKADFIAKYKNSITAQRSKGLRK